jgi:hypothetical protein
VTDTMSGPDYATVWFGGMPYRFDFATCRRALEAGQANGDLGDIDSLADAVGLKPSTVRRFFWARRPRLPDALSILGMLNLKFEDVAKPIDKVPG